MGLYSTTGLFWLFGLVSLTGFVLLIRLYGLFWPVLCSLWPVLAPQASLGDVVILDAKGCWRYETGRGYYIRWRGSGFTRERFCGLLWPVLLSLLIGSVVSFDRFNRLGDRFYVTSTLYDTWNVNHLQAQRHPKFWYPSSFYKHSKGYWR